MRRTGREESVVWLSVPVVTGVFWNNLFTAKVQICCSLTCLISAVIPVGGFTSPFGALISPSVKREMSH